MDFEGVRTFLAAAEQGQFQEAAAELSVTQQAVSKRIAALEAELGVRLFTRTPRGAQLTIDGQAFVPHARAILAAVKRAAESVRPGSHALRLDVIGSRLATAALVRDFHRHHPEVELDLVTGQPAPRAGRSPGSLRPHPARPPRPGHLGTGLARLTLAAL